MHAQCLQRYGLLALFREQCCFPFGLRAIYLLTTLTTMNLNSSNKTYLVLWLLIWWCSGRFCWPHSRWLTRSTISVTIIHRFRDVYIFSPGWYVTWGLKMEPERFLHGVTIHSRYPHFIKSHRIVTTNNRMFDTTSVFWQYQYPIFCLISEIPHLISKSCWDYDQYKIFKLLINLKTGL